MPESHEGSHEPMKTKVSRMMGKYPWGTSEFVAEVYDGKDIVSEHVTMPGLNSWDSKKTMKFINLFAKYAKDHNLAPV
jgi:hypothetical protein